MSDTGIIQEAAGMIVSVGHFIKDIIANPRIVLEGIQAISFDVALISLAIIIGLRVLGVKEAEKYGYIILLVFLVIMAL